LGEQRDILVRESVELCLGRLRMDQEMGPRQVMSQASALTTCEVDIPGSIPSPTAGCARHVAAPQLRTLSPRLVKRLPNLLMAPPACCAVPNPQEKLVLQARRAVLGNDGKCSQQPLVLPLVPPPPGLAPPPGLLFPSHLQPMTQLPANGVQQHGVASCEVQQEARDDPSRAGELTNSHGVGHDLKTEQTAASDELAEFSAGSVGHPHACAGACRYVKRKGGCRDGAGCTKCHLCFWRRVEGTAPCLHDDGALQEASRISAGTRGHPHSCGAPCRYARRKGGCRDGASCPNCHVCLWQRTERAEPESSERLDTSSSIFADSGKKLQELIETLLRDRVDEDGTDRDQ